MRISLNSMNALRRITYARSMDASKPALNGVALEPAGPGKVWAAATDGFILAWGLLNLDEETDTLDKRLILPGKLANEIGKIKLSKKPKPASLFVEITDDLAWLHRAGFPSLSMRWAEGIYPKWQKVVPSKDTICPWCGGRFSTGVLEQASKALGNPAGFLPLAVTTGRNIHIAHCDGVFVQAMPIVSCDGNEANLAGILRRALDVSPVIEEKAS